MTIEKIDGVWAETGTKESTLTAAKKTVGWVGGDRPTMERFNYLQNRVEETVDNIITDRALVHYEDASDPHSMIMTGLWDESWGCCADSLNSFEVDATAGIADVCTIFNSDGEPRLLALDGQDNANKLFLIDPRDMSVEDSHTGLESDLPTGSSQNWVGISMCTDGTYVYIMFVDIDGSPTFDFHVQSWDVFNKTVNSSWPATGTALPGSGNISAPYGKIIVANSTNLATANVWNTISAATSDAITIINKASGAIVDSAAGDAPTGVSAFAESSLCSDGTNIYFLAQHGSSTNTYVCSATIANPQVGCGGSNFPLTTTYADRATICACGPNLIVSVYGTAGSETEVKLRTHNASDADLEIIETGTSSATSSLTGDQTHLYNAYRSVFDGLHLWIYGTIDGANAPQCVMKIDVAQLMLKDISGNRMLSDLNTTTFIIENDGALLFAGHHYVGITYDGRDIWCSSAGTTDLFRIPLANIRG